MAIIAAMKNVLSPNSETIITESDATKACTNPKETVGVFFVVCSEVRVSLISGTIVGNTSSLSSTGSELVVTVAIRTTNSTPTFVNIVFGMKLYQHSL